MQGFKYFCPHTQSFIKISSITRARATFASTVYKSNIYVCGGIDQNEEYLS